MSRIETTWVGWAAVCWLKMQIPGLHPGPSGPSSLETELGTFPRNKAPHPSIPSGLLGLLFLPLLFRVYNCKHLCWSLEWRGSQLATDVGLSQRDVTPCLLRTVQKGL